MYILSSCTCTFVQYISTSCPSLAQQHIRRDSFSSYSTCSHSTIVLLASPVRSSPSLRCADHLDEMSPKGYPPWRVPAPPIKEPLPTTTTWRKAQRSQPHPPHHFHTTSTREAGGPHAPPQGGRVDHNDHARARRTTTAPPPQE